MKKIFNHSLILAVGAFFFCNNLFSQDTTLEQLSMRSYSNIEYSIEIFNNNRYVHSAKGKYLNGRRVGIWTFETRDYDSFGSLSIDYLEDSSIVLYPYDFLAGCTLITKDKQVFLMKDKLGIRLRRWCIEMDGIYNCYQYDIRQRVTESLVINDMFEAIDYLNWNMINIVQLKEMLFSTPMEKK